MKILGTQMNLRLVFSLVASAAVFSFADSTSIAKSQGNRPGPTAKPFKKLDPATKEKWQKEKSRLDAKREEDRRKDRAEREANLDAIRQRSTQGNRPAAQAAKDSGPLKKGGKASQQKPASTDPLEAAQEKVWTHVQKQQADSRADMAKDIERMKKVRQEEESRRGKVQTGSKPPKAENKAGVPSKPDNKGGK